MKPEKPCFVEKYSYSKNSRTLDEVLDKVRDEEPTRELPNRICNQLKYREKNLTLRDHDLLNCLSNFQECRARNPSKTLQLRYVTNASPGKEPGITFPGDAGGIAALRRLSEDGLTENETKETVRSFKELVRNKDSWHSSRPEKERYSNFRDFVAQAETAIVIDFIRSIIWALDFSSYSELTALVHDEVVKQGFAPIEQADDLANRLLANVLDTLSAPGRLSQASWKVHHGPAEGGSLVVIGLLR